MYSPTLNCDVSVNSNSNMFSNCESNVLSCIHVMCLTYDVFNCSPLELYIICVPKSLNI